MVGPGEARTRKPGHPACRPFPGELEGGVLPPALSINNRKSTIPYRPRLTTFPLFPTMNRKKIGANQGTYESRLRPPRW